MLEGIGGSAPLWAWAATVGTIIALLTFDLLTSRGRRPSLRRALLVTAAWIVVSCAFGLVISVVQGFSVGEQFFAAYLLEKSLSIDNVFVFAALFALLAVPAEHQHRVLQLGVIGALVLRAWFIAAGAAFLDDVSWAFYVFGVIVLVGGVRMLSSDPLDPHRSRVLRFARHRLPVTRSYEGARFVVRRNGAWMFTPLFLALVAIETTDIVFATDSIPAVFGVTRDVFVVLTSNMLAVMGLRALYFVVADFMDRFRYLKYALAVIMCFIGVKLLLNDVVHVPAAVSLIVLAVVLVVSVASSLLVKDWSAAELPARPG